MRIALPEITVAVDGTPQAASSTIATAGAYVVVVATTLPDLAVGVTSVYLGDVAGPVAVSHLHLGPAGHQLLQRQLPALGPGVTHARACLLDHAAALQAVLGDSHGEVEIDVGLAALERAAAAWDPTR